MPKLTNIDDQSDQENMEPFNEEDNDRAHSLVRNIHQNMVDESESEQMTDDTSAFDPDHTLNHEIRSEHRPPTPTDSNQEPVEVNQRTSSDQEDDPSDDSDEPVLVKPSKKRTMPQKKATKRQETTDSTVNQGGRNLRARTPAQKTPFAADKLAYTMTKSRGRNPSKAEIDKQLKKQMHTPPSKSTKKQPKRSKVIEAESSGHSATESPDPSTTEDEPEALSDEYKFKQTTVRFVVAGSSDEDGGIELTLFHFVGHHVRTLAPYLHRQHELQGFIDFSNDRWGRVHNYNVHHITCERPWKGKDSSLAMYEGWEDQFDVLVKSVLEAPIWRKKSTSPPTLDVKLIVTLKVPP